MFRTASASSRRVLNRATHAVMEPMDGRQLCSASLISSGVMAGTLVIEGTSKNDHIELAHSLGSNGAQLDVIENGKKTGTFKYQDLKIITANLGGGDDKFFGQVAVLPTIVHGGDGNDTLFTGWGNDTLNGNKGNDSLVGNAGRDLFNGGAGNDSLNGGDGSDWLYGGEDNDSLQGGDDHDLLHGGSGADTLRGGAGSDTIDLRGVPSGVRISLDNVANDGRHDKNDSKGSNAYADDYGKDIEVVYGTDHADLITGSSIANTIYGMKGHDTLGGGHGNDSIYGGDGDDNLYGDEGHDRLSGENGNDGLYGGRDANDTLYGGAGRDRFLIHMARSGTTYKTEDKVADKSGFDVNIRFWDNFAITNSRLPTGDKYSTVTIKPDWWKENDVERVDAVLSGVSLVGNGARILSYDGRDVNFWRAGQQTAGRSVDTWSWDKTDALFTGSAFTNTERLRRAVTGAVGMQLAHQYANIFAFDHGWRRYEDLSGADLPRYISADAGWVYSRGNQFVNSDAKTRPTYDFVETFKKVVHDQQGWGHNYADALGKEYWIESKALAYLRS